MTPAVAKALLVSGEGEEIEVEVEDVTEETAVLTTVVAEEATEAATGETAGVVAEEATAAVTAGVAEEVTTRDEAANTLAAELTELIVEAAAAVDTLVNAL